MKRHYHRLARDLADKDNGWHLGVVHMKVDQVLDFCIEDMAARICQLALELWELVSFVLSGDEIWARPQTEDVALSAEEVKLWEELGDVDPMVSESSGVGSGHTGGAQRARLRQALCRVKTVIILSIFMHSVNQQCNVLAAVNGIFFHSCNTPDKVIKALAHMGISISPSSINNAINSLSNESQYNIRELGQSLEAMYAYDNLEISFNTMTPMIEQSGDRLIHLTTGLIMKMDHGVTADDLRCSKQVWQKSRMNPAVIYSLTPPPQYTFEHLLTLHRKPEHPSGLNRHGRFTAWLFLDVLCRHGPKYFWQFLSTIPEPEPVETIPVMKLKCYPVRAMNINQSKIDGNIQAIANLQNQAGIGDPGAKNAPADTVNISEYVTLALSVVFVPGVFHERMACVDSLYRIFIDPADARLDDNSLMKFVGRLRPKETIQIGSKPKFRQMHEVVQHTGIVLHLDCWRTEARHHYRTKDIKTLDDFAAQKPTFEQLTTMVYAIIHKYVAGSQNLYALCRRNVMSRLPYAV
ncbi:hypothetical protein C8Q72DRAFT_931443 [Fomitopsis betulina]|nr:hypothetical protein C8Q72DRAFT_931443 [Fomitopsis betulina]